MAAALDAPASAPVDVALTLGSGAYTVTGAQRISIAAGSSRGTTTLAFTPTDDSNAADDAVAIGGTAAGHRVTGTALTIREPVIADGQDVSGLGVALSVSPTALREGGRGAHRVSATLTGVPVPKSDVAMVLAVGGTATEGAAHDFTLKGGRDWRKLAVAANDPFLTAGTRVTVSARADGVEEGDETVTFSVAQAAWGATVVPLRPPATATLTITEAWEAPAAPAGLTAAPSPGGERHGLDVAWEAVAANPPVDGYVVRHRKVAEPPAQWTASKPQPGLRAAVTGLSAGTRYEVRVRADSAAGQGAESGSAFARTADGNCGVGAPQVAVPSGARSATELDVSWQAASCAPVASISSYLVRYREDPDLEGMEGAWLREASNGTAATLAGLAPDTAYEVQVRAVATGGDRGPWSPAGRGRTGLDARLPPRVAAPEVTASADRGDARLDVAWRRVTWTDPNDVAQPVSDYQYRYRPDGGDWTAPTDARATGAEAAAMARTLAGLKSGTWHEAQVRGVNRLRGAAHPGKWSEPGRGRTWGVPDRVEEPAAYGAGGSTVVAWEAPDDGGSPIDDYDVRFKADGDRSWTTHPYAGCAPAGCATETTIKAAAAKVQVRAGNAVGMGRWSPTARAQALKLLRASFGASEATLAEGGTLRAAVRLDGAADRAVAVPLAAAGDADAFRLDGAPGGRVSFSAGESARTFELAALQDADRDGEAVALSFGPLPPGVLAGSPAVLSVTIEDDDGRNRKPGFAGPSATRAIPENSAAGAAVGAPVAASDGDGDALTHSLAGAGAAAFTIDAATGQVRVGPDAALDFEGGPASYALRVDVSDGRDESGGADPGVDASVALTVEVTDVLEPPPEPDAPALEPGVRSMSAGWSAPAHSGPPVTGHVLAHREAGAAQWTETTLEGAAAEAGIEGLSPGSAHEVRVRAVNDEGTGPWSAAAAANTLPAVLVEASEAQPVIGADGAPASVTLTARVEASGGTLEGGWQRAGREGTAQLLSGTLALESGKAVTLPASSSSPGWWLYSLRVSHRLDGRESSSGQGAEVEWLPTVALSAAPAAVPEGSARTVRVTAALTGDGATASAKAVAVTVAGGTATAGEDFAGVGGFAIRIPGGARSAEGTFELSALADSADEGAETVLVSGDADQAGTALPVAGATVFIKEAGRTLTVTRPADGHVTGTDGGGATVIDCGSGGRPDCAATAARGTVVTLTPTADAGHGFGGWSGDCSGRHPCKVALDADRTVGARFPALPGSPTALAMSPAGHDGLRASWAAPAFKGTGITAYELRHRRPGTASWSAGASLGTGTQAAVAGLAAGARHEAQVRAAAKEGWGPWSALVEAVTLPSVSLSVDVATPAIGVGGLAAAATLIARATAEEGSLTGRWVRRTADGLETVNGQPFAMESGRDYRAAFSHDAPGLRAYGLMAAHGPNRAAGEVGGTVEVRWLPTVVLSAAPSAVAEGGGARRVSVTARLTGSAVEDAAKSVTVRVGGGTAAAGTDFKAVDDFAIALSAGARQAAGRFELTPVADADQEGAETVTVSGSAVQGGVALPVAGATVTIEDAARRSLTVAKPANGRITGTGIDCGGQGADCSESHPDGAAVTLKAAADSGHLLRGWTGDCSGTGDCALSMDADKAVGASFAAERALTVAKPSNGKVTGTANGAAVIDCGADCAETLVDGTVVALRAAAADGHRFDAWGGACASEATASCSVTLDADKSVSVAFASTVCAAGDRRWTAGGNACAGSVTGAASGRTRTATDGDDPTRGSASFKCEAGAWVEQAGATCTVDLSCGAAANACLTPGVEVRNPSATAAVDGACASTESAGCLKGTTYSNRPDIELKDGECGLKKDECVNGTFADRDDTDSEHRWRCEGIDAEDRWSCLGVAGSMDWSCGHGSQSKACGVPTPAKDDSTCGDGEVTQEASDSPLCVLCKDGYETHGGACVAECGANEVRGTDGKCVCETGLSRVNGKCVKLHRLTVEVDPRRKGTVTSSDTTSRNFSCSTSCATHVEDGRDVTLSVSSETGYSCELTDDSFKMTSDKSVTANCDCADGYAEDPQGDCVRVRTLTVNVSPQGAATVTTDDTLDGGFSCTSSCSEPVGDRVTVALSVAAEDGYHCGPDTVSVVMNSDRAVTVNCDRVHTLTVNVSPQDAATVTTDDTLDGAFSCTSSCSEPVEYNVTAVLSVVAKVGYHCGPDTVSVVMNSDRAVTVNCDRVHRLTVKVDPSGKGTVKTDDTLDGVFTCSTNCSEPVKRNKDVALSVTPESGHRCDLTKESFTMTSDMTVTANCDCADGYAEDSQGDCVKVYTLTVTVKPAGKGTVTTDDTLDGDFSCSTSCSEDVKGGVTVDLSVADETGYDCSRPGSFEMRSDKPVTVTCTEVLKADAGGDSGKYTAQRHGGTLPFGGSFAFYLAPVSASASGGVRPYSFQWSGHALAGAAVTYGFPANQTFPVTRTVTVTDEATPKKGKDMATATIEKPGASAAASSSEGEDFALEVPLDGELLFVWGGGGEVEARSMDEGVVRVSVSSPSIRIMGVGLGETQVVFKAGGEELALRVAVR